MKDKKVQKIREEVERRLEDAKAGVRQNQNRVKFGIDNKQDLMIWQHLESMAVQLLSFIDSIQEEPKFKTGDRIKPIDSCLGSPRTIIDVRDSWYVTDQGTLDFEFEDNWEAVEEPVSKVWHDASEMPKEKKVCLIRYSVNDGASTNNFEVVIAEPLTRRFVTRSYPHKTGYQHTIHGETTIKVDEYQDRREKIPFSDIDEWAYIDDLLNINL